jgi:hypothetical protein
MTKFPRRRPPTLWPFLIALAAFLGIGSRRCGPYLPGFVASYAGDTLWALAAFLVFGLILSRTSTWRLALLAISFSVMIEISQLYHAPWIDSIRHTAVGGLVLGFGFVWSDLACYVVGVELGVIMEGTLLRRIGARSSSPTASFIHLKECPVTPGPGRPAGRGEPRR